MFIDFKTVIPKQGDIKSFINKPVLDKMSLTGLDSSKVIGVIKDAVEVEEGFELTISIYNKYKFEWIGVQLNSMSLS